MNNKQQCDHYGLKLIPKYTSHLPDNIPPVLLMNQSRKISKLKNIFLGN